MTLVQLELSFGEPETAGADHSTLSPDATLVLIDDLLARYTTALNQGNICQRTASCTDELMVTLLGHGSRGESFLRSDRRRHVCRVGCAQTT